MLAAPAGLPGPGQVAAPQRVPPPPPLAHPYDPSLDPAIKHLLDQQAEIQAKLAVLLPKKYGSNIKVELDMLRHKLRVLMAYADEHRKPSNLSSPGFEPFFCSVLLFRARLPSFCPVGPLESCTCCFYL